MPKGAGLMDREDNNQEDAQLIKLFLENNNSGFNRLVLKYQDQIHNLCLRFLGEREEALDCAQETFVKVYRSLKSFKGKAAFSTWLYQIARNTVIDHYRTSRSEIDIQDVWDLSSDTDIAKDAEIKDQLETVEKYLNQLDSNQREIIILRVWEQMSYKEIAEIVGKSEAGCKMMFLRSIEKLRLTIPLAVYLLFLSRL